MAEAGTWKVCSICRKAIRFEQKHYVCSVSTCRRPRTMLYFCSLDCFGAHVPTAKHRDAWAEEERAPSEAEAALAEADLVTNTSPRPVDGAGQSAASSGAVAPVRRVVTSTNEEEAASDVLVVASKLKQFIRARAGMNTSDSVMQVLSNHLRDLSVAALRHAAEDGRKTVQDRDFEAVLQRLRRGS